MIKKWLHSWMVGQTIPSEWLEVLGNAIALVAALFYLAVIVAALL